MLDLRSSLLILTAASAAFGHQIAVYWGQNAAYATGVGSQTRLLDYCTTTPSDIVMLSFIYIYPDTTLNFANQCGDTFPNSKLLHCPQIAADVKACQKMGKKVLMTLGGAVGDYGFPDDASGAAYAQTLLDLFGPVVPGKNVNRPLDDAVVDGFNIAAHRGKDTPNTALVKKLKELKPDLLLAAAPNCGFPDAWLQDALDKAWFDYVFVQFYNFDCGLDLEFNWKVWSNWAKTKSVNKNVKVFVSVVGASRGPDRGYANSELLCRRLPEFFTDSNFGGFSIWDASSAKADGNYAGKLRCILDVARQTQKSLGWRRSVCRRC